MKYIRRHIWALVPALTLAALSACEREVDSGRDGLKGDEPEALIPGDGTGRAIIVAPAETRTDFDSYVGKFAWSDGDKIAIHLSDGTFYETEVNAETGAFTCSTTSSKQRDAYAIYPASARDASNYGSPTLNVVLPAEYDIHDNLASDYSPVPMIAVNRQAEDDIYFRHVGGLLRITCNRVPAATQRIKVTFDQNVAGTFTVANPASDNPTITGGGDSKSITFLVAQNWLTERTDGIVLNIPIPMVSVTTMKIEALATNGVVRQSSELDVPPVPRGHGKKLICNVTPAFIDSMQMIITASEDNSMTFRLPFSSNSGFPADLRVEWGDGSETAFLAHTSLQSEDALQHTYTAEGDYTITLTATAESQGADFLPTFRFEYVQDANKKNMLKSMPTPLLKTGNGANMFKSCKNLESVCEDLFIKNPRMSSMASVFYECSSLHSVPGKLFALNPDITTFKYAFCGSGLTGLIPEELFAHNPLVTSFEASFMGCQISGPIPEELFAHNPLVTSFYETFRGCSQISDPIPAGLFAHNTEVTSFADSFSWCTSLPGPIAANLFANNRKVTSFSNTFYGCTSLTGSIPEQLFANCPDVTSFWWTFSSCESLTGKIPPGLFAGNPKVIDFAGVFSSCKQLSGTIPAELFAHNPDVKSFSSAFYDCDGLTAIPAGLFSHNPEVTTFASAFGHSGIKEISASAFSGCSKVTSFDSAFWFCPLTSIPAGLFSDCTGVTSFYHVFCDCKNLTGSLPSDLFRNCPNVITFESAFRGCSQKDCTVPSGLFAHNPLAVNFHGTFWQCFRWKIPGDLFTDESAGITPANRFASVDKAVDFYQCFYQLGANSGQAGTAPALWEFTFPSGEGLAPISTGCFSGATSLTNWPDIDVAWK